MLQPKRDFMQKNQLVAKELAKFFGVLAHPLRIQIVEELQDTELTVSQLQERLDTQQALLSQHLAVLRTNRMVVERREGRNVFYHLRHPEVAQVIIQCIPFVAPDLEESDDILSAIKSAKADWVHEADE